MTDARTSRTSTQALVKNPDPDAQTARTSIQVLTYPKAINVRTARASIQVLVKNPSPDTRTSRASIQVLTKESATISLSVHGDAASDGSGVLTVLTGVISLSGHGDAASDGSGVLTVDSIVGPSDVPITWYMILEMDNGAGGGTGTYDATTNPLGHQNQFTQTTGLPSGEGGPSGSAGDGILGHGIVNVTDDRPRVLRPFRNIIRKGGRS